MNPFPFLQILDDVAVSPNLADGAANVTCAFPMPCALGDGSLICCYRRGREKHSRDGVLVCQRSQDEGRSWSKPIVIFDGLQNEEPESVHTGALSVDGTGGLLAIFTAVEAQQPDEYIFSETGRKLRQRLYIARSYDGGCNWSAGESVSLKGAPRNYYVGSRPFLLSSGELFLPIEATSTGGSQVVLATTSGDCGATWQPIWTCAADPKELVSYGDPRFAILPGGKILMLVWSFVNQTEESLAVHRCISRDQGRTWSQPESTDVSSQIMAPLALDADRLIAVSNVRTSPQGIRLWFSSDAGATWTFEYPIQMWDPYEEQMKGIALNVRSGVSKSESNAPYHDIWGALPGFTFGTPDLISLSDSQSLLTYYATVRGVTHIRACRFRHAHPIYSAGTGHKLVEPHFKPSSL